MYELKKKLERYLRVNLLRPGPRLIKKVFTAMHNLAYFISHPSDHPWQYSSKTFHVHAMKAWNGSRGVIPLILNRCTMWKKVVKCTHRPPYLWEITQVPVAYEAGWDPEPVWTFMMKSKHFATAGIWTQVFSACYIIAIMTKVLYIIIWR